MRLISTSDLGGRPDALQVIVDGPHAYVSHPFSGGFSVLDVSSPDSPRPVAAVPTPPFTQSLSLQQAGDLLLVANEAKHPAAVEFARNPDESAKPFAAGLRVFDVERPGHPREIAFLGVAGFGMHRLFWTGGPLATASLREVGSSDYILATIDMQDPVRPTLLSTWAPAAFGAHAPGGGRLGAHHGILDSGGRVYSSWRDGGVMVLDATEPHQPALIHQAAARTWGGANTHTVLPLPARGIAVVLDEAMTEECADGTGGVYLLEIGEIGAPRFLAKCPMPADADYCARPGRFGPHNLHENHPGSLVSDTYIFCAFQNAGLRVFDIADAHHPREIASFVPEPAAAVLDPRVGPEPRTDSADVFVTAEGLAFLTDMNGGLSILEVKLP